MKKGSTMKRFMWPGIVVFVLVAGLGSGIGIGTAINSSSSSSSSTLKKSTKQPIEGLYSASWDSNRVDTNLGAEQLNFDDDFVIGLVTDGAGTINDKSFNEGSMQGILSLYGLGEKNENLYKQSSSTNQADIETSYTDLLGDFRHTDTALNKRIIVAPGYGHTNAIKRFWSTRKDDAAFDDVNFLFIDQSGKGKDFKNTLGFEFDVRHSSFYAGYLSALFLDAIGDEDPKVGLWGGGAFPGVTSFMVGFVSGIKYYNDSYEVTNGFRKKVEIVEFNTDEDYTNSGFDPGQGRPKADYLIEKGADVILPVAGSQTGDLISAIKASSRKDEIKVVGVDVDQTVQFEADKNIFLTSIIKNLGKAVYEGYKYIMKGEGALADAGVTPLPTNDDNGTNNTSFIGTKDNGFSDYVKQFDVNGTSQANMMWKDIYTKVDSVDANATGILFSDWESSLNYIKSLSS